MNWICYSCGHENTAVDADRDQTVMLQPDPFHRTRKTPSDKTVVYCSQCGNANSITLPAT